MEIEDSFSMRVNEEGTEGSVPPELDALVLDEVLKENEVAEEPARHIIESVDREFSNEEVNVSELIDDKALKSYSAIKRERELVKEVEGLKAELSEKRADEATAPVENPSNMGSGSDIDLFVGEEIEAQIGARLIDDRRYILIPISEDTNIKVNGKNRKYEI